MDGRTVVALGAVFGIGVLIGRRTKQAPVCPPAARRSQSAAQALIQTHDTLGRMRPFLEPVAAGRRVGVSDAAAFARALGG